MKLKLLIHQETHMMNERSRKRRRFLTNAQLWKNFSWAPESHSPRKSISHERVQETSNHPEETQT